ncbi:hypothetical protein GY21_14035 [Cryobacterium roopkundense]|uniref:RNA polymerase sigma factor 70 region 4 type 2 domain-containing protein n=1 Tax=Cryobacterium roopkundense TaxID=1001240 RepID=A0A099J5D0_9MICO|nr:hypothetical protein GY21_14035 [Cryobacterium roopkundense]
MRAARGGVNTAGARAVCKVPARRWRAAIQPSRVTLALLSLALIVMGTLIHDLTGLLLLGLGAVALLAAVVFPVIRGVEFGFPTGVRISAGLRDREQELQAAFQAQRGDLGLYTQLICDDPALASELLEAAWARTAAVWRGPVTPELRTYVLCEFVHVATVHARWRVTEAGTGPSPHTAAVAGGALSALPLPARISVVLREFADLPTAQISSLTGRPLAEVVSDLVKSETVLARFASTGDDS